MQTRIAPTPSGYLHIGNACSFLLTCQLANHYGGTVRLRIDDIDNGRTRSEYLADIFRVLTELQIAYEYGPKNVADFENNYSQHLRLPLYEALLADLCLTDRVYACTCSRREVVQQNGQCHCRQMSVPLNTQNAAWRLYVPDEAVICFTDEKMGQQQVNLAKVMGNFVVRKKDGLPAYQIASLADDLYYGIDYVVRGQDLLSSTAAQLYMAQLTSRASFLQTRFYHHPLVTHADGVKYSKSTGDRAISVSIDWESVTNDIEHILEGW